MALRLIPFQFRFSPRSGGPQTQRETFFDIDKATTFSHALLTGFRAGFNNGDHSFGEFSATLKTEKTSIDTLEVTATLTLRDYSGNWDDPYSGEIDCVVIIESADS